MIRRVIPEYFPHRFHTECKAGILAIFHRERTLKKETPHIELQNESFLSKAPEEVIQQERVKLDNIREELKKLSANLEALDN